MSDDEEGESERVAVVEAVSKGGETPPEDAPPSVAAPPTPAWETRVEEAAKLASLLDFAAVPKTKAGWAIRIVATFIAIVFCWRRVVLATHILVSTHAPPPIPTEEIDDYKFRLPEHTRKEIFEDLATAELAERDRAAKANTWNGHLWSREDDRGHYERVAARAAAVKFKISLAQVYLVLDEGIREHWPAPNGQPLPATTPPLNLRSNSW